MTHSRHRQFGSAADATAAQQQMSLVRQGAADQQAGVAVVTAGQQMKNFKAVSAAAEAAEMKGQLGRADGHDLGMRRPETTGSRGGSASGRISRSARGCPAAAQAVLRPVGPSRGSSELSRPDVSQRAAAAEEETEDIRLHMSSEVPDNGVSAHGGAAACAAASEGVMVTTSTSKALAGFGGNRRSNSADQAGLEWYEPECAVIKGTGESASRPVGLMQDPVQLQWQQMKRQQMVLDGCGGEAEEECWDGSSRNGGAAACAASCQ